jgi:hypothetical protein
MIPQDHEYIENFNKHKQYVGSANVVRIIVEARQGSILDPQYLATLQEIHGATKDMRLEIAVDGLGAPLHAGALRYYREVGLEIPERLIIEEPVIEEPAAASSQPTGV